jgi:DNA-binding transcriptional ArsR family regulator
MHGESLGRLLRHPLRQHLLFEYTQSVTSPSEVAEALGERLNVVSYHTNVLLAAGCLELVRTERRRGAREHFYRAVLTSLIEDPDWEQLPEPLRRGLVRLTIDAGFREAADALPHGGMDSATAHVSRSFLTLDGQGRDALAALLRETLAGAFAIERQSRARSAPDHAAHELLMLSFERASPPERRDRAEQ